MTDPLAMYAQLLLSLALAPLALGVINKTKAMVAGRRGQPILQAYFDLVKLLRKGAVYSSTTSWVFRAGPVVGVACASVALAILPWAAPRAFLSFEGDLILLAYVFGLMRFFTVIAALDTGSAFEGMGASREVWFSALAEPALLLGLFALAREAEGLSLATILGGALWSVFAPSLLLVAAAVFIVLLAENARIPVDDPNTHLELTMIHEVMVLDHGGVDLAFMQYASAAKLWAFSGIFVGLLLPRTGNALLDTAVSVAAILGTNVIVGMVESVMARLRLVRVPQLLVAATSMSALALLLDLVR